MLRWSKRGRMFSQAKQICDLLINRHDELSGECMYQRVWQVLCCIRRDWRLLCYFTVLVYFVVEKNPPSISCAGLSRCGSGGRARPLLMGRSVVWSLGYDWMSECPWILNHRLLLIGVWVYAWLSIKMIVVCLGQDVLYCSWWAGRQQLKFQTHTPAHTWDWRHLFLKELRLDVDLNYQLISGTVTTIWPLKQKIKHWLKTN